MFLLYLRKDNIKEITHNLESLLAFLVMERIKKNGKDPDADNSK
jgi:hypothetical protein